MVLLSIAVLHILSLNEYRWRPTDHVRVGLFVSAGLALGLASIASNSLSTQFNIPLWCMPVICGIIFLLFLVTHLRWPRQQGLSPLRLRTPSLKAPGHESTSFFESSVYHFDTKGQGHEPHTNGEVDVASPGGYMSLQSPEYSGNRWPANEYGLAYI